MAEIVNLRQARKRKARMERENRAEQNRLVFGRTKVERQASSLEAAQRDRHLDGHRLSSGKDKPSTTE